MLFDFHTHAFADAIAERAMASLINTTQQSEATQNMKAYTNGTISGLCSLMQEKGIDKSLIPKVEPVHWLSRSPAKSRSISSFFLPDFSITFSIAFF